MNKQDIDHLTAKKKDRGWINVDDRVKQLASQRPLTIEDKFALKGWNVKIEKKTKKQ